MVDYYRKFLVVQRTNGLLVDDLIRAAKTTFMVFRLPKNIVSDACKTSY